jgi:hypothetical protein
LPVMVSFPTPPMAFSITAPMAMATFPLNGVLPEVPTLENAPWFRLMIWLQMPIERCVPGPDFSS